MHSTVSPAPAVAGSKIRVPLPNRAKAAGTCPAAPFIGTGAALRRRSPVLAVLAALVAAATACDRESGDADEPAEPIVAFDTSSVRIETATDTFQLHVDVAESAQQRAHGMMERDHLAPDAGMLFLFTTPQDASSGFYMWRVRIPLDIAFIDEDGRIVSIRTMQPCTNPNPELCPTYTAGAPFSSTLEVNAGYFAEHGIEVGDRVVHQATTESAEAT